MRPSASASAPMQLTSALTAAQDARLAAAVKAGELTQAQADAIKARRAADGTVLVARPRAGRPGRAWRWSGRPRRRARAARGRGEGDRHHRGRPQDAAA